MSVPGGMSGDELTGSPELFASNLLVVRAIEHEMNSVVIRRTDEKVLVQNIHDERNYEEETLTEQLEKWSEIQERFQSMTTFSDDNSNTGELTPNTPATRSVDRIEISYPDDSTIKLTFHYPN